MGETQFRHATLDDTAAISALLQAQIPVWQRIDAHGTVQNLPHAQLSIYERWQHGGAWMSIETAAIHLSRLLRGAGMALIGEQDGRIVAYAELYPGDEPAPFGRHLHLAHSVTDHHDPTLPNAMLRYAAGVARSTGCQLLTRSTAPDESTLDAVPLATVQRYTLPTRTGQGFYKVNDHTNSSAAQIDGWQMPIGRTQSAATHWEALWTRVWELLPEVQARRTHRLYISAAGHEALVCCQQQLYNPRAADLYCWSPKPVTPPLLTALRDWAHRQEYRALACVVHPQTVALLGSEAEPDPYIRQIYAIQL
ncbi:MAG: hypothetical protein H7Y11_00920 [Armatimonadetes bacterium]|nr:hypothetical protein [Anaerolineae bacterium]